MLDFLPVTIVWITPAYSVVCYDSSMIGDSNSRVIYHFLCMTFVTLRSGRILTSFIQHFSHIYPKYIQLAIERKITGCPNALLAARYFIPLNLSTKG